MRQIIMKMTPKYTLENKNQERAVSKSSGVMKEKQMVEMGELRPGTGIVGAAVTGLLG